MFDSENSVMLLTKYLIAQKDKECFGVGFFTLLRVFILENYCTVYMMIIWEENRLHDDYFL